jgi:glycosyltransferase involved in cell wall biosynthesis
VSGLDDFESLIAGRCDAVLAGEEMVLAYPPGRHAAHAGQARTGVVVRPGGDPVGAVAATFGPVALVEAAPSDAGFAALCAIADAVDRVTAYARRGPGAATDVEGWLGRVAPAPRTALVTGDAELAGALTAAGYAPSGDEASWPGGALHVGHGAPATLRRVASARVNVGRTAWYTDRLPTGWHRPCAALDEVWVPTQAARAAFAAGGVPEDRLRVVPTAVDTARFTPDGAAMTLEGARGFTFLSVFDWTLRKGWDVLVAAYLAEFSPQDDVALVLKPSSTLGVDAGRAVAALQDHIVSLGHDPEAIPEILFEWGELPADGLAALYRAADCFVLPTRGEGLGRALLEAQACGVPAIATATGAAGELLPPGSPLRLDATDVPVSDAAARERPALTGQRWAEPDVAALARLLRAAVADPAATAAQGAQAAAWVVERHGPAAVAAALAGAPEHPRMPPRTEHPMVHVVMPLGVGAPGTPVLRHLRSSLEAMARQTHRDFRLTVAADEDLPAPARALIEAYGAELAWYPVGTYFAKGGIWKKVTDHWQATESGFVAYLHYDDLWALDKLEQQLAFIAEHELEGAYCRGVQVDDDDVIRSDDLALPALDPAAHAGLHPGAWVVHALLLRRDTILRSGLMEHEQRWAAVFEQLFFLYVLKIGRVAKCPTTTFFYRDHPATITNTALDDEVGFVQAGREQTSYTLDETLADAEEIDLAALAARLRAGTL